MKRLPILYFVRFGPDSSHKWDAKPFEKLKDARKFVMELPKTPTGFDRPFIIERFEYINSTVYGDIVNIREVKA